MVDRVSGDSRDGNFSTIVRAIKSARHREWIAASRR